MFTLSTNMVISGLLQTDVQLLKVTAVDLCAFLLKIFDLAILSIYSKFIIYTFILKYKYSSNHTAYSTHIITLNSLY